MASHEENTNDNPANPSLPQDLIISEIFSRLPAESVLDLRDEFIYYDLESWESLISSPEFAKTHLSKSTNDPGLTNHRFLLITWPFVEQADIPYMEISSCSVKALLDDEIVPETVRTYHPGDDNMDVVGYCNGLFCLTSRDRSSEELFLWNPFTGISRRLPKHEHEHRAQGFCYDESNDDYKVFAFSHPGDEYKYNVSVYSSKSGCWRIIGDYYFGQIYGRGSFANGAMHSLVIGRNAEPYIIVSIDIKTETFREIPLPPKGEDGRVRTYATLDTFGESLSVRYSFETHADFWVMKECGVEESWTKLFTIPRYSWIKPLCISESGEIIFLSRSSTIVLYNPKDNTFKDLLTPECHDTVYVYTYVENLVSPPKLAGSTN